MGFRHFKSQRGPIHRPAATLSAEGTFYLNSDAMKECVRDATFVELYFDVEKRIVGLKFVNAPGQPGRTRCLTRYNRNGKRGGLCATIQCREFYREFGLPLRRLRLPLILNERAKLWTFKVAATE